MTKGIFLHTFGCQMNVRDSEIVLGMLGEKGFSQVQNPEEADVILINTCSVRAHAEDKAVSLMGRFQKIKERRPNLLLGMIGCQAKAQGEALFDHLPCLDLILGPANIYDLPVVLDRALSGEPRILAIDKPMRPEDGKVELFRAGRIKAFVSIMEGCNHACSYCIVPTTRGRERSRKSSEILDEVRRLFERQYREVMLLGQNVNSYGKGLEEAIDFPGLLYDLDNFARAQGPSAERFRIRFTTSHPLDASERMFEAMRDCPTVCEFLHLPVQSGSSRILRAMLRGYTREHYLERLAKLRDIAPKVVLSTDIIIGFPGETEEDFEKTVSLMREVAYDHAFIFKFSPRPGTRAAQLGDDVPRAVQEERLQRLLALQDEISLKKHAALVGTTQEVLVEEPASGEKLARHLGQTGPFCLKGRTRTQKLVVFISEQSSIGEFVPVRIEKVTPHTLLGTAQVLESCSA